MARAEDWLFGVVYIGDAPAFVRVAGTYAVAEDTATLRMLIQVPIREFRDDGMQPSVTEGARLYEIEDRLRDDASLYADHVAIVTRQGTRTFWFYSARGRFAQKWERELSSQPVDPDAVVSIADEVGAQGWRLLANAARPADEDRRAFERVVEQINQSRHWRFINHLEFDSEAGAVRARDMAVATGFDCLGPAPIVAFVKPAWSMTAIPKRGIVPDLVGIAEQRAVMGLVAAAGDGRYLGWNVDID